MPKETTRRKLHNITADNKLFNKVLKDEYCENRVNWTVSLKETMLGLFISNKLSNNLLVSLSFFSDKKKAYNFCHQTWKKRHLWQLVLYSSEYAMQKLIIWNKTKNIQRNRTCGTIRAYFFYWQTFTFVIQIPVA